MAPPRPYWKGYLKLSLVSCPVSVYAATSSSERVAFRQINRKTGNRLRQQLLDEGTREPVESEDKGRGYEVSKGVYLPIADEDVDSIAVESSHTIDIDSFVPRAQIDERYLESPYYLAPNEKVGEEAFAVIREAMRNKDMVALGRVVISKRERVMMLKAWEKGILGTTLRYPYEVRDAKLYFDDIPDLKLPKEMLQLAEHILETKRADFQPQLFVDRYEEALVELIRTKQAGMPVPKPQTSQPAGNIVNLMEALRQSLAGEPGEARAPSAPKPKSKSSKKRSEGQREMLLPITGTGDKKPAPAARAPRRTTGNRKAG